MRIFDRVQRESQHEFVLVAVTIILSNILGLSEENAAHPLASDTRRGKYSSRFDS